MSGDDGSGTTANNIWATWTSSSTDSATSATWTIWVTSTGATTTYHQRELTAEEQAAQEERQREYRAEAERKKRQQEESIQRAKELLYSQLIPEQIQDLERNSYFHVIARDGRRYRIRSDRTWNVEALDDNSQPREKLCFVPQVDVPIYDHMLVQKLLLEIEPETALAKANRQAIARAPAGV